MQKKKEEEEDLKMMKISRKISHISLQRRADHPGIVHVNPAVVGDFYENVMVQKLKLLI